MTTEIPIRKRERYRELMSRSIGAGVGVYYLGFVGYLVVWRETGVRVFDERESRIEQRAGQIVFLLLIVVTVFALPADVVFDVTGLVDVPVAIRGAIWGYALLLTVALIVYGWVARRHS